MLQTNVPSLFQHHFMSFSCQLSSSDSILFCIKGYPQTATCGCLWLHYPAWRPGLPRVLRALFFEWSHTWKPIITQQKTSSTAQLSQLSSLLLPCGNTRGTACWFLSPASNLTHPRNWTALILSPQCQILDSTWSWEGMLSLLWVIKQWAAKQD